MPLIKTVMLSLLVASPITFLRAEPTTPSVRITSVRTYGSNTGTGGMVFVTVDAVTLCGSNTFMINMGWGAAKEMVATALTAQVAGRPVRIEIEAGPCASPAFYTQIQSIYIDT